MLLCCSSHPLTNQKCPPEPKPLSLLLQGPFYHPQQIFARTTHNVLPCELTASLPEPTRGGSW